MTGLSIIKSIYQILNSVDSLKGLVFPLVAKEGIDLPFINITRESIQPQWSKSGLAHDIVFVQAMIVSSSYSEGIEISETIRETLERNYDIGLIRLEAASEGFEDIGFIQTLHFSIINNK